MSAQFYKVLWQTRGGLNVFAQVKGFLIIFDLFFTLVFSKTTKIIHALPLRSGLLQFVGKSLTLDKWLLKQTLKSYFSDHSSMNSNCHGAVMQINDRKYDPSRLIILRFPLITIQCNGLHTHWRNNILRYNLSVGDLKTSFNLSLRQT